MKPFDLEKAKAGEPVVTRGGLKAEFLAEINSEKYPLVFVIAYADGTQSVVEVMKDGVFSRHKNGDLDLFMAPKTVTKWYNAYKGGTTEYYDSKEKAEGLASKNVLETRSISWEE